MLLREFFATPLQAEDFIQQTNIIGLCDYLYYSPFFCRENFEHFGIKCVKDCVEDPPNKSCIIMCRFKDGEVYELLDKCSHYSHNNYIVVQTLIGDDGYLDQEHFNLIPDNVKFIFSKNIRFVHPKIRPIPIGRDWRNTSEHNIQSFVKDDNTIVKNLAYLNFSVETCPPVRGIVYEKFHDEEWVTCRMPNSFKNYTISHTQFVREIHAHKFCFSPVGFAYDCYRTWDALFAKTIPIVDHNCHVDYYADLPILFIDTWEEINKIFLEQKYQEMLDKDYNIEMMMVSYWRSLFNKLRNEVF